MVLVVLLKISDNFVLREFGSDDDDDDDGDEINLVTAWLLQNITVPNVKNSRNINIEK